MDKAFLGANLAWSRNFLVKIPISAMLVSTVSPSVRLSFAGVGHSVSGF
jgi:hypothetical protein